LKEKTLSRCVAHGDWATEDFDRLDGGPAQDASVCIEHGLRN
jgi:hypothetical protein